MTSNDLSGDELLKSLYYNPESGLSAVTKLYKQAKTIDKSLTIKKVKEWLKNQETNQVLSKRKIKHEYPIVAYWPFQKLQIDLMDVSNSSPKTNGNNHFIFIAIDVYSRYAFCIPIKSKSEIDCSNAFYQILTDIYNMKFTLPTILTMDNESAFKSNTFTKICDYYNIQRNFTEPGRKDATGIVERFIGTLRRLFAKYEIAYSTNDWIKALPLLIKNYNNSEHSTLKSSPIEFLADPKYQQISFDRNRERVYRANNQQYNEVEYKVGDRVRLLLKKSNFVKQTVRFSSTIHTITKIESSNYFVSDRVYPYTKKELMKVDTVERGPEITQEKTDKIRVERSIEEKEKRISRRINKEGISRDIDNEKENEIKANDRALRRYRKPRDMGFNISYSDNE